MDLKDKVAKDALVPLEAIFMLEKNDKLDLKTMNSVCTINFMFTSLVIFSDNDFGNLM